MTPNVPRAADSTEGEEHVRVPDEFSDPAEHLSVRNLRLLIEDWQSAGLTHLPRAKPIPAAATPLVEEVAPPLPVRAEPDEAVPSETILDAAQVAASSPPAAIPEEAGTDMPREAKQDRLQQLAARVAQCTLCRELAQTRTQTVFGVGNPNAKILFIGEAPGADEDREGEPFVGRAGQKLNDIIRACKLTREEIYICNILRCRPPGNRNPSDDEAANCRPFLDAQIEIVRPKYIVCWGSVAARNLLGTEETIGKLRGRFYEYRGAKVICTYHPSYLLRNPPAKKDTWADMKFLFRDMGIELTP